MPGLNEGRSARPADDVVPPVLEGPRAGPTVGVVAGGYGSEGILRALLGGGRFRAGRVEAVAMAAIAPCDVLIFTQRREPASFSKRACWLIWEWVEQGGRLLLTHDAVGYRDHPVLFPWVCTGGTAHVERQDIDVTWTRPGAEPLGRIAHSYYDHILLRPCLRAAVTVIAVDAQSGEPVVSGAEFDSGRVVACGLALGVARDDSEAPPTGGEYGLLEVMLDWLLT